MNMLDEVNTVSSKAESKGVDECSTIYILLWDTELPKDAGSLPFRVILIC